MTRFLVLAAAAFATGCSPAVDSIVLRDADPGDPRARAARAPGAAVMSGFTPYRPVGPGDWRDLNRRVAPPGALPPRT